MLRVGHNNSITYQNESMGGAHVRATAFVWKEKVGHGENFLPTHDL